MEAFLSKNYHYKIISNYVPIDKKTVVLDLGCGYGRFIEFYVPLASFVYGIEITDYIIDICKTKFAGIKNVKFIKNNGYSLKMIDDNSIDLVSCYAVFQHIPRKATYSYFKEFSRILSSYGEIIVQFQGVENNNNKTYNDVGLDEKSYKVQFTKEDIENLAKYSELIIIKFDRDERGNDKIWYWVTMRKS